MCSLQGIFFHVSILVRTFWSLFSHPQRSITHTCTRTHTLKPSPAGVLQGEAEMSLLPSLSGVSVSSPPGGIPSFLILLVVGLKAQRSTPLDLSTVIILTSAPQHLHSSTFINPLHLHLILSFCFSIFLLYLLTHLILSVVFVP